MLFDFFRYINTPNDYLECYSTFLMTNKDLKKNILNHRMNVLINSYVNDNFKNKNKLDYYYYYLSNHKDNYLDRPLLSKEVIKIKNDNDDDDYDGDVIDHYKFMTTKPPPKPEIDYDKLDEKFYEEEYLKELEKLEKEMNNNEFDDDEYYEYDCYDDYEEIDDNETYYEDYW